MSGLASAGLRGALADQGDVGATGLDAMLIGSPEGPSGDAGQPLAGDPVAAPSRPEVFKAGRWDRARGNGAGFASGGVADDLPPGPTLAGLAGDAWDRGLERLSDDELIGVLRAARRLTSWAGAMELAAAGDLWRRREAEEEAGDTGAGEHTGDEIAAALTLTGRSADQLLDLAIGLRRLPMTSMALAAGDIDVPRAMVIAQELAGLADEHAAVVERAVLGAAPRQTTGQLRRATHRAVLATDPAAARQRKEQAQREARVERWTEPAGTAALAGRDLPPAAVLAADANLTALAKQLKAAGADGTLDNLRAKSYLALLSGAPVASLLVTSPGTNSSSGTNSDPGHGGSSEHSARSRGGPAGDPGAGGGGPGNSRGDRDRSRDRNGGVLGDGGGASDARDQDGSDPSGSRDPDGSSPSGAGDLDGSGASDARDQDGDDPNGSGSGDPGGPPADVTSSPVAIASPSDFPGLSSAGISGRVNLTLPLSTWLGQSDIPGYAAGYGPLDAADSRTLADALAARADSRWCLTLTDAHGTPVAHGCAKGNPAAQPPPTRSSGPPAAQPPPTRSRGRPAARVPATWTFTVSLLERDPCSHARQTAAYRPSPALRHLIEIRQSTCTFPGCLRPATRCDKDHTVPYHLGGRTCECNLAPLCRRHHAAKQARGWTLEQPSPGVMAWTTPAGRRYPVTPTRYRS